MAPHQLLREKFSRGRGVGEKASSEMVEANHSQCFEQLLPYSVQKGTYQYLLGGKYSLPIVLCDILLRLFGVYCEVLMHWASSENLPVGRYLERLHQPKINSVTKPVAENLSYGKLLAHLLEVLG